MEQRSDKQPKEQTMYSINDMLAYYKLRSSNRSKWLYRSHMAILIPWLVIRYLLLQPVYVYFRDLIREQNGDIRPTKLK